jgi:hypothetical protein
VAPRLIFQPGLGLALDTPGGAPIDLLRNDA